MGIGEGKVKDVCIGKLHGGKVFIRCKVDIMRKALADVDKHNGFRTMKQVKIRLHKARYWETPRKVHPYIYFGYFEMDK